VRRLAERQERISRLEEELLGLRVEGEVLARKIARQ
jgi:hypothetical protein